MLTAKEIAVHKQRLLDWMKRIKGNLGMLREETLQGTANEPVGQGAADSSHSDDVGQHQFEAETNLSLLNNEEFLLAEIEDALGRIEKRKYGKCEQCNMPIAKQRLSALPCCRFCIECAQRSA